jgi:hypothetical protein
MKLRMLVGAQCGEIRDYSPIAARGALSTGFAEVVNLDAPGVWGSDGGGVAGAIAGALKTPVSDRTSQEKPRATPTRRKG